MVAQTISHEEVPFTYDSDAHEGRLNLAFHGELDLASSDLLASVNGEEGIDLREVLMDISDLEFIDTAGVRALLEFRTRNQGLGRSVAVSDSSSLVRKVIRLFGREDVLPAH